MGEGRGSSVPITIIMCAMIMVGIAQPAFGATYTVGDSGGWTFNVENWTNGKSFKVGDLLVFNYSTSMHNVVRVSQAVYTSCNPSGGSGSIVYHTGKDTIKLNKGPNYFICTFGNHCQRGVKIAAFAT